MGALWPVAAVRLTVAGLETTGAVMTIGPSIFHRYRFLLSNRKHRLGLPRRPYKGSLEFLVPLRSFCKVPEQVVDSQ